MKTCWTFRCYLTPEQEQHLARTFGCVRYVWNWVLRLRSDGWRAGDRIGYPAMDKALAVRKLQPETVWLNEVSTICIEDLNLRGLGKSHGLAYSLRSGAEHRQGLLAWLGSATRRGLLAVARVYDRPSLPAWPGSWRTGLAYSHGSALRAAAAYSLCSGAEHRQGLLAWLGSATRRGLLAPLGCYAPAQLTGMAGVLADRLGLLAWLGPATGLAVSGHGGTVRRTSAKAGGRKPLPSANRHGSRCWNPQHTN